MALGFFLGNVEDGNYRYLYPHEKELLLGKLRHVLELQKCVDALNIVDLSAGIKSSIKWKCLLVTNMKFFVIVLNNGLVGCKRVS